MDVVDQLASLALAAVGFVGAGWAAAKWLRRPRFICGIPPTVDERDEKRIPREQLGRDSVATAFRHRPDCFARPFHRPHRQGLSPALERRLLDDPHRCRSIVPDQQGRATLPVLIANRGKRVADYTATVTLYADGGKVHIVDVETETVPFYVYADRRELVAGSIRTADRRIVDAYDAYLMDERMMRWGDVVAFAGGHLSAGLFELAVIEVEIEDDLDSFFVLYSIDCADGWTGARTFIQACTVAREHEPVRG